MAKELVKPQDPFMPTKEAARLLNLAEATVRRLADEGLIECIRDENGERRFLRESVARFLALKRQNEDSKVYRQSSKKLAKQIAEARRAKS